MSFDETFFFKSFYIPLIGLKIQLANEAGALIAAMPCCIRRGLSGVARVGRCEDHTRSDPAPLSRSQHLFASLTQIHATVSNHRYHKIFKHMRSSCYNFLILTSFLVRYAVLIGALAAENHCHSISAIDPRITNRWVTCFFASLVLSCITL